MPYNTTAIPPRKEVTGQTQLPLSRVKKIVAQDPDITVCSNNAAFVITLATEMFIQYLAEEGLKMAKLERKPRRNIQYKDIANAVSHQDNLEFLSDMVPKTVPYKQIKAQAAAKRAQLNGQRTEEVEELPVVPNGKKHKSTPSGGRASLNGGTTISGLLTGANARLASDEDGPVDPNDQLQSEARQARGEGDVEMTG